MDILPKSRQLKKELSLFGVYAIATGTTLSAGFFLLPGLAAAQAGSAVVLAYVIAAIFLVPATFSMVELATAMPRAGGAYYFLDRSLGPLAGTIGGLGTWLALVLKSAFALVGLGAYVSLFFEKIDIYTVAAGLAMLFGIVNLLGARRTGGIQMLLVIGLLAILTWFIIRGSIAIRPEHFRDFLDVGFEPIMSTAGLVFISYVGLTKIASVSEEVKNPERNLPLGIFLALATAVLVYALGISVMVGVVGPQELAQTLTPVEKAAESFSGRWGVAVVSFAALLAFSSVANAGILSASRYPLAMGRDNLVPRIFARLSGRRTPRISIMVTVAAVLFFLLVLRNPTGLAKLASAFQLLMFGMICLAVIVMRESGIESYDPGYRSPLYPWMQIVGIVSPIWIIGEMGWMPILFSTGMVAAGIGWYVYYGRQKVERHGAIYHVFERLGRRRFPGLDRELRSILKEKGLREEDPFEEVVARAYVLNAKRRDTFERVVEKASTLLAQRLPCTAESLAEGFLQGTRTGATPVSGGVALPHMRLLGIESPQMVLARSTAGISVTTTDVFGETRPPDNIYAMFFLVSPEKNPGQHLRLLAEIAGRVDQEDFLPAWLSAQGEQQIKEIMLRGDRYLSIRVAGGATSGQLIGRSMRDVGFPEGCLVAIIRREGETLVPTGGTVVQDGDLMTVIGEEEAIRDLRDLYGIVPPADLKEGGEGTATS